MRVSTLRALTLSPPISSLLSITAGGSVGMFGVSRGAGFGLLIFGACAERAPPMTGSTRLIALKTRKRRATRIPQSEPGDAYPAFAMNQRLIDRWRSAQQLEQG